MKIQRAEKHSIKMFVVPEEDVRMAQDIQWLEAETDAN